MSSNKTFINLTKGQKAIIDNEDLKKVEKHKWHAYRKRKNGRFYAKSGNGLDLHRFIVSEMPANSIVSFKNGNSLDCRKINLEIRTLGHQVFKNQKTIINRKLIPDLSKFVGVRADIKFAAEYKDSTGRIYHFGTYKTPQEAATVYNKQMKILKNSLDEKVILNPENLLK